MSDAINNSGWWLRMSKQKSVIITIKEALLINDPVNYIIYVESNGKKGT